MRTYVCPYLSPPSHYHQHTNQPPTQGCLRDQAAGKRGRVFGSIHAQDEQATSTPLAFNWDALQAYYPYVLKCPADPDVHHIVLRGLYAFSYEYYLRFFAPETLHVITQEELKACVRECICMCITCVYVPICHMPLHTTHPTRPPTITPKPNKATKHILDHHTKFNRRTNKGPWRASSTSFAFAPTTSASTTWSPSMSRVHLCICILHVYLCIYLH